VIYPLFIAIILAILFALVSRTDLPAEAGSIRIVAISPEHPLTVRLAQGHTTAISFAVRPEKVVPGNPQAIEINFLTRDLTIRPLAPHPGNLIVYTKSSRYVILLQIGTEANYDDVVSVRAYSGRTRTIQLNEDSFHVDGFVLTTGKSKKDITAEILESGYRGSFQDLPPGLRCKGCVVKDAGGLTDIACKQVIAKLDCRSGASLVQIARVTQ